MAEWLRRWTRNPLGSPRAGSNPADYEGRMTILVLHRECSLLFGNNQVRTHCAFGPPIGVARSDHEARKRSSF